MCQLNKKLHKHCKLELGIGKHTYYCFIWLPNNIAKINKMIDVKWGTDWIDNWKIVYIHPMALYPKHISFFEYENEYRTHGSIDKLAKSVVSKAMANNDTSVGSSPTTATNRGIV